MSVHRNRGRTVALLGTISAGAVLVASPWGWPGVAVAAAGVIALNCYVLLRGSAIALRAMHAYPVGEAEQPTMYRLVRELTVPARVPMPRIYVSPTRAANAFAVGRAPARAAVCCTEGILDLLDARELRAVLAHELAHIRRGDTLTGSVAAAVASVVLSAAGDAQATRAVESGRSSPIGRALLAVVGGLAALVVRVAVRPRREYAADAEAARITGDPLGLAAALRKLEMSTRSLVLPLERDVVATSHAMIAGPLPRTGIARLFALHPPMADRVAILEQRAGYRR